MSNLINRTIFNKDNLVILREIDSNSVDLIYLDPPFNTGKKWDSPIGSNTGGASFKDIWGKDDVDDSWDKTYRQEYPELYSFLKGMVFYANESDRSYLSYMAIRLVEMHRILKPTGSLYYHIDGVMAHYIKIVLDIIFGRDNYKNDVAWKRTSAHNDANQYGRNKDNLLFYVKSKEYTFNTHYTPYDQEYIDSYFRHKDSRGKYALENLTGAGINPNDPTYKGYNPAKSGKGRHWAISRKIVRKLTDRTDLTTLEKLELLDKNGYLGFSKNGIPRFKSYVDDLEGVPGQEIWDDISSGTMKKTEEMPFPTQKPLSLLERIISTSSNPGDMVLDPFCGCATACVAAEKLGRQWVGIDVGIEAYDMIRERLVNEVDGIGEGQIGLEKGKIKVNFSHDPPMRSADDQKEIKSVYIISNASYPGYYKVGISGNVKRRLNSYQTGDPNRGYKLEYSKLTPHYSEIEEHIHNKYYNLHEWVEVPLEELKNSIENYKP